MARDPYRVTALDRVRILPHRRVSSPAITLAALTSLTVPPLQLIYNFPEELFADAGVMAIEHADFDGIERLALVTGYNLSRPDDGLAPQEAPHLATPRLKRGEFCSVTEQRLTLCLAHRPNRSPTLIR